MCMYVYDRTTINEIQNGVCEFARTLYPMDEREERFVCVFFAVFF